MKKILIVGGSKGLGRKVHVDLNSYHDVVAVSRTSPIPVDLSGDAERIKSGVGAAIHQLGGLDAVVVSSGQGAYHNPLVSADSIEKMFRVNTIGPMIVYQAALKHLLKSKGKMIVVTSTAARRPGSGGLSVYAATKGALHSWVISEGRRLAKKGVALCAVAPGWFASDMTDTIKPEVAAANVRGIPFGRYGTVDEISSFITGLLDQSNWCLAGQIFELSGGA
jgi:3-oxoacyl-[acyl-carrier protein] reductase